jgi:hypothetical protein
MVEAGEKRGLFAEVARQRDDLDIEPVGGKLKRCGERAVAAAVIHVNHLGRKAASCLQRARHVEDASVQRGEIIRLVEQGNHERQAGIRPAAWACGRAAEEGRRICSHRPPFENLRRRERL